METFASGWPRSSRLNRCQTYPWIHLAAAPLRTLNGLSIWWPHREIHGSAFAHTLPCGHFRLPASLYLHGSSMATWTHTHGVLVCYLGRGRLWAASACKVCFRLISMPRLQQMPMPNTIPVSQALPRCNLKGEEYPCKSFLRHPAPLSLACSVPQKTSSKPPPCSEQNFPPPPSILKACRPLSEVVCWVCPP